MGLSNFNTRDELQAIITDYLLNRDFEQLQSTFNLEDALLEITQAFNSKLSTCCMQEKQAERIKELSSGNNEDLTITIAEQQKNIDSLQEKYAQQAQALCYSLFLQLLQANIDQIKADEHKKQQWLKLCKIQLKINVKKETQQYIKERIQVLQARRQLLLQEKAECIKVIKQHRDKQQELSLVQNENGLKLGKVFITTIRLVLGSIPFTAFGLFSLFVWSSPLPLLIFSPLPICALIAVLFLIVATVVVAVAFQFLRQQIHNLETLISENEFQIEQIEHQLMLNNYEEEQQLDRYDDYEDKLKNLNYTKLDVTHANNKYGFFGDDDANGAILVNEEDQETYGLG